MSAHFEYENERIERLEAEKRELVTAVRNLLQIFELYVALGQIDPTSEDDLKIGHAVEALVNATKGGA